MNATEKLTRLAEALDRNKAEIAPQFARMRWQERHALVSKWQVKHPGFVRTIDNVIYLMARNAAVAELAEQGITLR